MVIVIRADGQDKAFECDQRTMPDCLSGGGRLHCKSLCVNRCDCSVLVFTQHCCGQYGGALGDKLSPLQYSGTSRIQCQTNMRADNETCVCALVLETDPWLCCPCWPVGPHNAQCHRSPSCRPAGEKGRYTTIAFLHILNDNMHR